MSNWKAIVEALERGERKLDSLTKVEKRALLESRHDPKSGKTLETSRLFFKAQLGERVGERDRAESANGTFTVEINPWLESKRGHADKIRKPIRVRDKLSALLVRTLHNIEPNGTRRKPREVVEALGQFDDKNILRAFTERTEYGTLLPAKNSQHYFKNDTLYYSLDGKTRRAIESKNLYKRIYTARKHVERARRG